MDAPLQIFTCAACDGKGYTVHRVAVYEHGCGFPHDDSEERPCPECSGYGEFIGPCQGDAVPARPRWHAAAVTAGHGGKSDG